MDSVFLGLGLIGIGRPWGHVPGEVPAEKDVARFLEAAWELGIRYFDTAPSYGSSEERLGKFLNSLTAGERAKATVATKFGEHWNAASGEPFVDHSFDGLRRSLDSSARLLGRIDVLQLHKTTPAVLASPEVAAAWEYARPLGIGRVGPSVSDEASARAALGDARFNVLQFPYNQANPRFDAVLEEAGAKDIRVAVNRPFAMGAMLYEAKPVSKAGAFRFILRRRFRGVILTGTRSAGHLRENLLAFQDAAGGG